MEPAQAANKEPAVEYLEGLDKAQAFLRALRSEKMPVAADLQQKIAMRITEDEQAAAYLAEKTKAIPHHEEEKFTPFNAFISQIGDSMREGDYAKAGEATKKLDELIKEAAKSYFQNNKADADKGVGLYITEIAPYNQIKQYAETMVNARQRLGGVSTSPFRKETGHFFATDSYKMKGFLSQHVDAPLETPSKTAEQKLPLVIAEFQKQALKNLENQGLGATFPDLLTPLRKDDKTARKVESVKWVRENLSEWAHVDKMSNIATEFDDVLVTAKQHPELAKQSLSSLILEPKNWQKSDDHYHFPSLPNLEGERIITAILQSELGVAPAREGDHIAITPALFAAMERRKMALENAPILALNRKGKGETFTDDQGNGIIPITHESSAAMEQALAVLTKLNVPYQRKEEPPANGAQGEIFRYIEIPKAEFAKVQLVAARMEAVLGELEANRVRYDREQKQSAVPIPHSLEQVPLPRGNARSGR